MNDRPTGETLIADTVEELRAQMIRQGLYCLPRQPGDEEQIVESWL
jgi:hypothetical protein